jgi:arsenate reductase-like glutaredoxin family protein
MKRIYHLSSCSTCKRIINEINPDSTVELVDIKVQNIDASTLDWIKSIVGSYEALFSKKAQKYRLQGLHEKQLLEDDYRTLLLEEYTFLKRPFCIHGENVSIGNTKDQVAKAVGMFNS